VSYAHETAMSRYTSAPSGYEQPTAAIADCPACAMGDVVGTATDALFNPLRLMVAAGAALAGYYVADMIGTPRNFTAAAAAFLGYSSSRYLG
jgi:hypothetical protein